MALATNDLSAVQLATGMGIVALFDAVFMGLAAFGFMLYIDPLLTLIAVAPMPFLALLDQDAFIPPAWKIQKGPGTIFGSDRIRSFHDLLDSVGQGLQPGGVSGPAVCADGGNLR